MNEIAQRVAEMRPDMALDSYHPHMCAHDYCQPQTQQQISGNPGDNTTVFVCKYGQYHVCDLEHCQCSVCPISGICYGHGGSYSSYDPTDFRTWEPAQEHEEVPSFFVLDGLSGPLEPAEKRQKHFHVKTGSILKRAEQVVETLLYSQERNKINSEHSARQKKDRTREKDNYVTQCKKRNQLPNMIHIGTSSICFCAFF